MLFLDVNGAAFTVRGASPDIPEEILSDQLEFLAKRRSIEKTVAQTRSYADATIDELEQTLVDDNGDSLICI